MNTRKWIAIVPLSFLLVCHAAVQADDLGKLFEQAAKKAIERQAAPDRRAADRVTSYTVKTADGWRLVATRYKPSGAATASMPVILCHGLSYNASFWDLDPACSFASYLSQSGWDVWAVSLRGCGLSQKWVWNLDRAPDVLVGNAIGRLTQSKIPPNGFATIDPKYAKWNLDDHINYDLPALIKLVRKETGTQQVAWVGHSMGGIIALAHLARYEDPGIARLVTVGSQVTMPNGQLVIEFLQEMISARQLQLTGNLDPQQVWAETNTGMNNLFFNERHVDRAIYDALATTAKDVPSINLLQQYMVLGTRGELLDATKQFNYARNISRINVPVLISCGEADQIAPPEVQRYLYRNIGSADKKLVIFGRSQGFTANAGHNDAIVGLTSRENIYPVIESWLRGK